MMYPQTNQKKKSLSHNWKRKIPSMSMLQLESTAHAVFVSRYSADDDSYNKQIIKDIVYNEKSHVVAIFKDYLIFDDLSEFLKRYYTFEESQVRLPKFFDYYENCSKIFPNYIILYEAKYIYKSIQKKQKMIDNQQRLELEMEEKENIKEEKKNDEQIFNTEVYNSIMNQTAAKDEDLASIFNISDKLQGNKIENSFTSMEKLIDCIGDAEKSYDKNHSTVTNRDPGKYNSVMKMMLPNNRQRLDSQFKMKEKESTTISTYASHCQASQDVKRNLKLSEMIQVNNNKLSDKNQMNILTERMDAFESNILLKKIKTRNKFPNEFVNLTALQDRLKEEYKKDFNVKHFGVFQSCTMLKDTERSKIKNEKSPDVTRRKTPVTTESKKSTLSVPKTTNNIFYIINKNPQLNTQITIINNNAAQTTVEGSSHVNPHAVNSSALQIKTDRGNETPDKLQSARDLKMKIGFLMGEKKTTTETKPELKNKQLSNILGENHLSRNHNIPRTASTVRSDSTKGQLRENLKKEELKPSNTLQTKQLTRTSSALPAKNMATLQYDELNKMSYQNLYDKYSLNSNTAKDRFIIFKDNNSNNFQKNEYLPLDMVSPPKEINYISNNKMRTSSVGKTSTNMTNLVIGKGQQNSCVYMNNFQKASPSPIRHNGFGTTSNAVKPANPFEYNIVSNSTKREIARPTISELLSQKEKQMKKIMEQNLITGKNRNTAASSKKLQIKGNDNTNSNF